MEKKQIYQVITSIQNNIEKCDILRSILKSRLVGDSVDYTGYYSKGYKHEEIKIGIDLVDLYIKLKNYIDRLNETR